MPERFGLSEKNFNAILDALRTFPQVEDVLIFGSRALGNAKKGSDVDLALQGAHVDERTATAVSALLNEELPLPYFFDVLVFDSIEDAVLREHIEKYGQSLFLVDGALQNMIIE
jgi:predicted nucleotidyltransferase